MFEPIADLIFALVTGLAGVLGGSVGLAIIALTLAFRIALFPISLRSMRRAHEIRESLQAMQPELELIELQYADDATRRDAEIAALRDRHGIRADYGSSLFSIAMQVPLSCSFALAIRRGLGAGVRFLSIGNLGNPSLALAVIVTAFAYIGVMMNLSHQGNSLPLFLLPLGIFCLCLMVPATLSLHWASSWTVGLVQMFWMRRTRHRNATA